MYGPCSVVVRVANSHRYSRSALPTQSISVYHATNLVNNEIMFSWF